MGLGMKAQMRYVAGPPQSRISGKGALPCHGKPPPPCKTKKTPPPPLKEHEGGRHLPPHIWQLHEAVAYKSGIHRKSFTKMVLVGRLKCVSSAGWGRNPECHANMSHPCISCS